MSADTRALDPRAIGTLVALVDQGRLSQAEQETRTLLATHPTAGMLWKILGVTLLRQGKEALPALRRTAELMPRDAEAHRNLGAALHDRGQWAEALTSLRRALALQPNDAAALMEAANALKGLGRVQEAVPLYQRALQWDPLLIEAHNNLGNAFLELRRYADAAGCYRAALRERPDDAQLLCNLGNALRHLKLPDEAIAVCRKALALDPSLSAAHNTLGLSLGLQGRLEDAVASYRSALVLDPGHVDALNNLGNVLRDLGRRREAVALYERAIELEPARSDIHCNVGTVYFELRRVDAAVASFRRALELQPGYAPAHLSMSLALRQQRRPDEAQASCRAALAIAPHDAAALSGLGELLADRGDFVAAEALFQRAIALDPDFSFAFSGIATHRRMTRADAAWLRGAQALLAKRLPLAHEIGLCYSLGKYFDDIAEYDAAFGHYERANELTKRYGAKYDGAALTRRVDELLLGAAHAARSVAQPERAATSDSELPVFIVGMPRSGTSLAEQILASHPRVFGAGEVVFWSTAYETYRAAALAGNGAAVLAELAQRYLEHLASMSPGSLRVVDKMPANFLYAGLIHAAFPRARIIHMQRHPIDTCLSIYFQNFFNIGPYANDLESLAHYYGEYARITHHWRNMLPASTLLEIPYAGLTEDQEGWTRRLLDFVGLPWDPHCLDFHETDRIVITASKWQVRQKISSASVGRWRHYAKFVGPLNRLMS